MTVRKGSARPGTRINPWNAARPVLMGLALLALSGLVLTGCGGGEQQHQDGGVPVRAMTVEQADVPFTQVYVGQTAGSREVEVRARTDGILQRKVYVEGSYVNQGDLMFMIEPNTPEAAYATASGELQKLKADLEMARLNKERLVRLYEQGVVSAQERDDAVTTFEAARASVGAAQGKVSQAGITLSYTEVRAPISGITSTEVSSEGSLVLATGDSGLLTSITQSDPLYVNFSIAGSVDLKMRNYVQQGLMELPEKGYVVRLELPDGSVFPREGVINFRDTHVSTTTGAIRSRAEFANPDMALLPGEIVRVHLEGAVLKDVITVPQRAVLFTQQGPMVFVLDEQNIASPRPIKLGDSLDGDYLVLEGLKSGERIVTEGVIKVRTGAPVTVIPDAPSAGAKGDKQGGQAKGDKAAGDQDQQAAPAQAPDQTDQAAPKGQAAPDQNEGGNQ